MDETRNTVYFWLNGQGTRHFGIMFRIKNEYNE